MKIALKTSYSFHQFGQRDNQEDSRYPDIDMVDGGHRFFLVCDGVGGCEKGEVASNTVCKSFASSLRDFDFSHEFTSDDFGRALDHAYDALDKKSDSSNEGMATTLTFICFHEGGCTMAHIGDSRIYQVRPSEGIIYRSEDHSLVNSMVHNGMITPEEAVNHPQSNIITRYMESVASDESRCMATLLQTKDIQAGDYFFLCTDGVLHCVTDEELVNILTDDSLSDADKIQKMAAMSHDSNDNNTAWLIGVDHVEGAVTEVPKCEDSNQDDAGKTQRVRVDHKETMEIESLQTEHHSGLSGWLKKVFK